MLNCAIVCEYNPFHTGHKYQIDRVRGSGADNIVCVMSGNFVQSAMPAFCDKSIRAESAVLGGADAVVELPALYATASAGYFAEGAVRIISQIKDISHIAMGATAESDVILRIADIKCSGGEDVKSAVREKLRAGKSYNVANAEVLFELYAKRYTGEDISGVFDDPNNILCIEYIDAIQRLAANISPLIIKRIGGAYNDAALSGEYVSATAIRNAVERGDVDLAGKYVPFNYKKMLDFRKNHASDIAIYKKIAVFGLKNQTAESMSKLRDCADGMENLFGELSKFSDFDAYVNSPACKKYGKKRINRLMLDCAAGIERDMLGLPFCTRLLACRNGFDFSILPSCVKATNADIRAAAADADIARVLRVDEAVTALYNTVCGIDGDYYNYSLIKV